MSQRPIPFAPLKKRLLAFAVDLCIVLGALTIPLCVPGFPVVGSPKFWFTVIGAYSLIQFIGLARPEYGFGRTMFEIFVVSSRTFERPTLTQVAARAAGRATIVLAGVALSDATGTQQFVLVPLLVDVALMMNHPQRQTIADLLAGTVVVAMPPYQPHRAPAMPMYSADDSELGPPPKK